MINEPAYCKELNLLIKTARMNRILLRQTAAKLFGESTERELEEPSPGELVIQALEEHEKFLFRENETLFEILRALQDGGPAAREQRP